MSIMFGAVIKFCDFIDRVAIKCLIEGVAIGLFASLALLAAAVDGALEQGIKLLRERRNGAPTSS
jgi:hypothetical protein